MKYQDLDLRELLEFNPEGGPIQFGGRRVLLFDAEALGILRRQLVETLGASTARGILLQFGFAHGWRVAESMKSAYPWDDESQWRRAGGRLHTLQGLVTVEVPKRDPKDGPEPFAEALWHDSFEAEQHLKLFGQSEEAVCWTLVGYASGYMSCCHGSDIVCIEDRCVAKGDAACHVIGKPREEWGENVEPALTRCTKFCLEANLDKMVTELKQAESSLRRRRRVRTPNLILFIKARANSFADSLVLDRVRRDRTAQFVNTGKQMPQPLSIARIANIHRRSQRCNARARPPRTRLQIIRHGAIGIVRQHDLANGQSNMPRPHARGRVTQIAAWNHK